MRTLLCMKAKDIEPLEPYQKLDREFQLYKKAMHNVDKVDKVC